MGWGGGAGGKLDTDRLHNYYIPRWPCIRVGYVDANRQTAYSMAHGSATNIMGGVGVGGGYWWNERGTRRQTDRQAAAREVSDKCTSLRHRLKERGYGGEREREVGEKQRGDGERERGMGERERGVGERERGDGGEGERVGKREGGWGRGREGRGEGERGWGEGERGRGRERVGKREGEKGEEGWGRG